MSRRIVIVGAAGAIGGACAERLRDAGDEVIGADLSDTQHICDVTNQAALETLARDVWPYDGVIYAPGVVMTTDVTAMDWATYRRLMAVNLDGAFFAAAAFARPMIEAKRRGAFVFLSSMAGLRGEAGASAYCASKFGIVGLVQSLAAEWAKHDIRCNAVCPGNVDSPMLRQVACDIAEAEGSDTADDIYAGFAKVGAATRLVSASEVASACEWLLSDAASAVTGVSLPVDAGAMVG